jgi:hypothetical protein
MQVAPPSPVYPAAQTVHTVSLAGVAQLAIVTVQVRSAVALPAVKASPAGQVADQAVHDV